MMRVLFTGVGRRIELLQAFRTAAMVLNKKLEIYGAEMSETAPALAYCDYVRKVVAMKDPEYINMLLSICEADDIDLIIPTTDLDLLVLSENKKKIESLGTKVMISSPDMIHICRDKNLTSQFFIDCGLHAPTPVNDWRKYTGGYPAFIKPKDGSSSVNAFKIENDKELEYYAGKINDYIVQPYISGREYTIDIFCNWEGRPISIVPRRRLQVRAGEVLKTAICMDRQMIEEANALCRSFKPCGPITVQLIRDENNIDWFIEINPRFGGGAPLSMKAGARSADAILKILDNEDVEYMADISNGAVFSRFDQSVCIYEGEGGEVKGIIFDLDDTLYSEKEYVKSGFRAVSNYLGGGFEEKLWGLFIKGKFAIDELLREIGRETEKKKVLEIYRNHEPDIHLYDGVKEMLEDLKASGKKVGIITDGRIQGQRKKIEALKIQEMVDDIIITDELGGEQFRKPCDIAFRILQTRWRLQASQMIYIGDNAVKDFQAPLELGMKTLWFNNQNGLYLTTNGFFVHNVVDNINDIGKYIH